jgi:peptidoglycan/xylan/chitin deacetylase (PgdA/CDA1 family)
LFREHLAYLADHDYTPITVSELVRIRQRGGQSELPRKPIVLTFDDGYADFHTHAFPALQQYGFTGTVYVPTAFVGKTSKWLAFERETGRKMLTWSQLDELAQAQIECGSHSRTHAQLDTLPQSVARDEIVQSKVELEDRLGRPVESFCYPFGYYDRAVRQLVQEAGYSSACACKFVMSSTDDDPFALARLAMDDRVDASALAHLLSRWQRAMPTRERHTTRMLGTVRRAIVRGARRLGVERMQLEYRLHLVR